MKINPVSSEFDIARTVAPSDPIPGAEKPAPVKVEESRDYPQEMTRESLEKAIERLARTTEYVNKRLKFSIHEASERMQVFVIDGLSQEVIKEIPPEEFLNIVAHIREMVGLLLDERV
ncbi:MAG: flagellar protein FlaG [Firmicutes bacterium]|nr:flagellar protein FlaG [Bacillota bacterium]